MYTYIKRDTISKFITFEEELSPSMFNNLGDSYEDYIANNWVLLSEEQVNFHNEHPEASPKEVWDLILKEDTLEYVKSQKIAEINAYDNSSQVNSFTLKGMSAWLTPSERDHYNTSVISAEELGVNSLQFYIDDTLFEVPTSSAKKMLAALQLYADQCFIITQQHIANVEGLTSIEEIKSYDYKAGYPDKLNFD